MCEPTHLIKITRIDFVNGSWGEGPYKALYIEHGWQGGPTYEIARDDDCIGWFLPSEIEVLEAY
jgi:hypothetical protein